MFTYCYLVVIMTFCNVIKKQRMYKKFNLHFANKAYFNDWGFLKSKVGKNKNGGKIPVG